MKEFDFEAFGNSITPHPIKQQQERTAARAARKAVRAPMVKHGLEKEQIEKAKQLMRYRKWKAEVREGMSRGDYGNEIITLLKQMRCPSRGKELVEYVQSAKWLMKCSLETRLTLLGYIDDAMIRHAIRNGYPPFDDAIPAFDDNPGESPTAFLIIRKQLTGV